MSRGRVGPRGWLGALLAASVLTCVPTSREGAVEPVADAPQPRASVIVPAPRVAMPAPRPKAPPKARPETPEPMVLAAVAEPEPPEPMLPVRAPSFEMTFVGDVIFGRYRETGYDPIPKGDHPVFEEVAELLRSDLLVGNLETPLVRELPTGSPIVSSYRFGADEALAEHLRRGGFGAVSLANNHAYDMRAAGIEQTPQILQELGVQALGAARAEGDPVRVETVEREGWRVGFVAITTRSNISSLPGVAAIPRVELADFEHGVAARVEDARASHDLVVVLVHWGEEYADAPSYLQRNAAHALVEAGADLVVGHHPHVLQGIERYGHGLIAYSMGNFLFENVKEVPRQTGVLRTRFDASGCLEAVVFHPAFVKSVPTKHPAPAVGFMGGKVKERVRALGQRFGTQWRDEGESLALEGTHCPAGRGPRTALAAP